MSEGKQKFRLILASNSPRRKEMMEWLNIPFEVFSSDFDEVVNRSDNVYQTVEYIAREKGKDVLERMRLEENQFSPIIISADTIVVYNETIYGKPRSIKDAKRTLKQLSGREHQVITAVYIGVLDGKKNNFRESIFSSTTLVQFDDMDEGLLDFYLGTSDSLDKAGSYGIQGMAQLFVKSINGSYSNVVGFPINRVVKELKKILSIRDGDNKWRALMGG